MFKGKSYALNAVSDNRTTRVLALSDDLEELIEKAKKSLSKQNPNFVDCLHVVERKIENDKCIEVEIFKIGVENV